MSCCIAVSVLLALAVTATATALPHEERQQDKGDAYLLGTKVANKDSSGELYTEMKPTTTQGDDGQSSSVGGSGEHSKEDEGSNKEGEKQAKSCITKEQCHKKKIICGKGCTLSAHSKCAAKCSKSCVPTC